MGVRFNEDGAVAVGNLDTEEPSGETLLVVGRHHTDGSEFERFERRHSSCVSATISSLPAGGEPR